MLKASEIYEIKCKVIAFIDDNDIIEYSDLVRSVLRFNMKDEAQVIMGNTFFFDKYITSRRISIGRMDDKIAKRKEELSPNA